MSKFSYYRNLLAYFFDHEAIKEDAAFPEMTHKSSRKSESQEEAYFGNRSY